MCNEGDAKNWTNLSNVKSFTLAAGATKQLSVSTNFFATCVAFSYYSNGKRVISYANGLNTSGAINVMTNYV
jgi:hypothetical protein